MEAIILAAGMGTRLGSLIPKPLTSLIDEKTILDYQIEKLQKMPQIHNIYLVVGYKKEIIMEKFPDFLFVYNNAYARTNTAKSLLAALNKIDDDVIWLNGDVFFDQEVLELLVSSNESACLVDKKKCGTEEVKYNLNADGYIQNLSKKVDNALGEALGINVILQSDLSILREELSRVSDGDYFEKAVENLCLTKKLSIRPVDVGRYFCREIDFEEDLIEVQTYQKIGSAVRKK
jgi:choline kinase